MKNYEEGIKKWDFIGWKENIGKNKIFEDHVLLSLHSPATYGGEEMKSEIQYCYWNETRALLAVIRRHPTLLRMWQVENLVTIAEGSLEFSSTLGFCYGKKRVKSDTVRRVMCSAGGNPYCPTNCVFARGTWPSLMQHTLGLLERLWHASCCKLK